MSAGTDLLDLLHQALKRETQVSVQYMFQHAIGSGQWEPARGKSPAARRQKFVASNGLYFLPGAKLKKTAIEEMRHAEAIARRIAALGGDPSTEAPNVPLGGDAVEMIEMDREQELAAIALYNKIIAVAEQAGDGETVGLFRRILGEEEKHLDLFTGLLDDG